MKRSNIWTFSSHTDDTHAITKDNTSMMKKKSDRQLKKISKSNTYIKNILIKKITLLLIHMVKAINVS